MRLEPPHRAGECEAPSGEADVTGHLEGLTLGRDRWCRNCTCCMVTVTYGTPGTYRTPLSPNALTPGRMVNGMDGEDSSDSGVTAAHSTGS